MRYLSWILGTTLFLLALGFAIKNSDNVTLHYYLGYQWQAPMALVILAVFFTGTIVGIAASLGYVFKQRRELVKLRRHLQASQKNVEIADASMPQTAGTHGI